VAFTSTGTQIAIAATSSPFIYAWPFSAGFGTRYSNPSSALAGQGQGVTFTPDDANIIISHGTTPFITAYTWGGSGFGTKYSDPATLPNSTGRGVSVSPDGADIVSVNVSTGTNRMSAYPWSSGFGTRYADPATLLAGNPEAVKFSRSGKSVGVSHATSPFVSVYPWASGFGTKYADPATAIPANSQGLDFA
jgi:hypothetical protein